MELLVKDTPTGRRTGETVRTKLASIAQRARRDKKVKFCSLAHLMSKGTLREAFRRLSGKAAPGIDGEGLWLHEEPFYSPNLANMHVV